MNKRRIAIALSLPILAIGALLPTNEEPPRTPIPSPGGQLEGKTKGLMPPTSTNSGPKWVHPANLPPTRIEWDTNPATMLKEFEHPVLPKSPFATQFFYPDGIHSGQDHIFEFSEGGTNVLTLTSNRTILVYERPIGQIAGTNFVPAATVSLAKLPSTPETAAGPAFADGVRLGAILAHRNPDVFSVNALVEMAVVLWRNEQAQKGVK